MTGLLDVLKDVVKKLDETQIEYFLVGSMATTYFGRPRFTQDVDLVIRIKAKQILAFESQFPLDDYYCPPREVLHDEVLRRGSFNLIHQHTGIKVDIMVDRENDFYTSEFSRKMKIQIAPDLQVNIASPEDLVLMKLMFYKEGQSEKHLNDIRDIMVNIKLDESYMNQWISNMSLESAWDKV